MELFKRTKRNNNRLNINNTNEMIIIYKINDEDNEDSEDNQYEDSEDNQDEDKYEIKLFGKKFIENNKNNCKIIIDNKEQDLIEYLKINKNEKILKIKLKEIKTITDMSYMFYGCNSLISLSDISNWNTSSITDMSSIFCECESLFSIPISEWKTNSVTNMSYMFYKCKNFKSLNDIQKWNTSSVTNMSYMFYGCKNLESLSSISSWDVQSVTNMEYMFYDCTNSLSSDNSLDNISKWNLSNYLNDNNMFNGGKSISSYKEQKKTVFDKIIGHCFNQ